MQMQIKICKMKTWMLRTWTMMKNMEVNTRWESLDKELVPLILLRKRRRKRKRRRRSQQKWRIQVSGST